MKFLSGDISPFRIIGGGCGFAITYAELFISSWMISGWKMCNIKMILAVVSVELTNSEIVAEYRLTEILSLLTSNKLSEIMLLLDFGI